MLEIQTKQVESLNSNKAIQYLSEFLTLVYIQKKKKLKGVMLSLGNWMKDCTWSATSNFYIFAVSLSSALCFFPLEQKIMRKGYQTVYHQQFSLTLVFGQISIWGCWSIRMKKKQFSRLLLLWKLAISYEAPLWNVFFISFKLSGGFCTFLAHTVLHGHLFNNKFLTIPLETKYSSLTVGLVGKLEFSHLLSS